MRILVCNDDGFSSPGIVSLVAIAKSLSDDVWVVAPDGKRTAGSHALTLGRPVQIDQIEPRQYSCSGTPADCVTAAMAFVFKDAQPPDLILSGINDGRNVAEDLIYSGTLSIAREGSFWGIPAIALSRDGDPALQGTEAEWIGRLIAKLLTARSAWSQPGHWLSFNLPKRLPAPLMPIKRIATNKIGSRCEIVDTTGTTTTLMFPRGRIRSTEPDDENDLLDRGFVVWSLQSWRAVVVDPAELVDMLARVE